MWSTDSAKTSFLRVDDIAASTGRIAVAAVIAAAANNCRS
jgi:hypothetical protein